MAYSDVRAKLALKKRNPAIERGFLLPGAMPEELKAQLASMAEQITSLQKIVANQDEAILELSEMLGDLLQIMAERVQ